MGQVLINSLINGSFYALSAMSFNLLLGTTKFFDVAHGARALLSAYIVLFFLTTFHLPVLWSIILGFSAAVFLSLLTERFIYRPLQDKKASNLVLLVTSFGVFFAIQSLLGIFFSGQFQTLSAGRFSETLTGPLGTITYLQLLFTMIVPITFILLTAFMKNTSLGKAIRAIGDNEEVAGIAGIDTKKIILFVFAITSAMAAGAAIFDLFDVGIDLSLGFKIILKTIIAAIIGGAGNVAGGVVGGYILGGAENLAAWHLGSEWQDAVAFLILIIFLVVRPRGIFGKK